MKIHDLKSWPAYFEAVRRGDKTFEIRPDDRRFEVGDLLRLREWDPMTQRYSGEAEDRVVSYVARDAEDFGLMPGFCLMSMRPVEAAVEEIEP
jgi:hypothetical protein